MRTLFTGLRPEQILESLVSRSEFCSKKFCADLRLSGFWAESEGQNPERDGRQNHRRLCNSASGLCGQKFVDQNPTILISLISEVVILNRILSCDFGKGEYKFIRGQNHKKEMECPRLKWWATRHPHSAKVTLTPLTRRRSTRVAY